MRVEQLESERCQYVLFEKSTEGAAVSIQTN
jgi:hypothetical protein